MQTSEPTPAPAENVSRSECLAEINRLMSELGDLIALLGVPSATNEPGPRSAERVRHAAASKAGEAEMARRERLADSDPALAAPKIGDWCEKQRRPTTRRASKPKEPSK